MSSVINETLLAIKTVLEAGVNIFNGANPYTESGLTGTIDDFILR